jgi:KDO2-lipid IV(A) lauroyltransferase
MKHIKKLKNTSIFLLVMFLIYLVKVVPFRLCRFLSSMLGTLAWYVSSSNRRKMKMNLSLAFNEKYDKQRLKRIAKDCLKELAGCSFELIKVERENKLIEKIVYLPDEDRYILDGAFSQRRGVVYITGHIGNWELMAAYLSLRGYPINAIGQKSYDERFTELIRRFRERFGVETIWRDDPDLIRKTTETLRKGEILGFLIDSRVKKGGVSVDFFELKASVSAFALMLASRTKSPLLFGFINRLNNRIHVIKIEPCNLINCNDGKEFIRINMQNIVKRIERQIINYPSQWVWMNSWLEKGRVDGIG